VGFTRMQILGFYNRWELKVMAFKPCASPAEGCDP
jgi:hypothetical protein